ncbi:MAG: hypothetical protein V3U72_00635, partial [Candidatus Aenigmarchaeota archaeon]
YVFEKRRHSASGDDHRESYHIMKVENQLEEGCTKEGLVEHMGEVDFPNKFVREAFSYGTNFDDPERERDEALKKLFTWVDFSIRPGTLKREYMSKSQ